MSDCGARAVLLDAWGFSELSDSSFSFWQALNSKFHLLDPPAEPRACPGWDSHGGVKLLLFKALQG